MKEDGTISRPNQEDVAAAIKLLGERLPKLAQTTDSLQTGPAPQTSTTSTTQSTGAPAFVASTGTTIASSLPTIHTSTPVSSLVMPSNPQARRPPFLTLDSLSRDSSQPYQLHSPTVMSFPSVYPIRAAPSAPEYSSSMAAVLSPILSVRQPSSQVCAQPFGHIYTQPSAEVFASSPGRMLGRVYQGSPTQDLVAQSPPLHACGWAVPPVPLGMPALLAHKGYLPSDENTPLLISSTR